MEKGNKITFELQERIPLEEGLSDSGQILNVELIPEIEMVAVQNAYRIRGFLIFTGEYEAAERIDGVNPPYLVEKEAYHNKRALRKIYYRIPVDISLPAEKVDENGVILQINSLDYELINPNRLLLTAAIELDGVKNVTEVLHMREDTIEPVVEQTTYWDREKWRKEGKRVADPALDEEEEGLKEEDTLPEADSVTEAHPFEVLPVSDSHPGERTEQKPPLKEVPKEVPPIVEKETEEEITIEVEIEGKIELEEIPEKEKEISEKEFKKPEKEIAKENIPEKESLSGIGNIPGKENITNKENLTGKETEKENLENKEEIPDKENSLGKENIAEILPDIGDFPDKEHFTGSSPDPILPPPSHTKISYSDPVTKTKEDLPEEKKGLSLFSRLFKNEREEKVQMRIVFVQPGQSIDEIAARYHIGTDEIYRYNGLKEKESIRGGLLKIPVRKGRPD